MIAELLEKSESSEQQQHELEARLQEITQQLEQSKQQSDSLREKLSQKRLHEQKLKSRQDTLTALQQAATDEQSEQVNDWLQQHQLASNRRLAETIDVCDQWRRACEVVLAPCLQAVCLPNA